jgi:DNA polymerase-3 subunit delta
VKIAPRDIEAFVRKPAATAAAILVYGPDEGLVRERIGALTATVVPDPNDTFNIEDIPGDALGEDPARLVDAAKSISMLGGRRVVRVRGGTEKAVEAAVKSAMKQLKAGDNLILIEAGELGARSGLRLAFEAAPNAAAVACYADDAQSAGRVVAEALRAEGYRIAQDALTLLSSAVAGDRAIARGEVEKLITYMGPMKDIGTDDVTACVSGAAAMPLDDLARHVASGRFREADRILTFALSEGTAPVAILRALQNHFMRLHMVKSRMANGDNLDIAMGRLKPPVFFKHKGDFQSQASSLSAAQIEQALNVIVSAEARCKQTASLPDIVIGRAVLSLCQLASKAAARRRA